MRTAVVGLAALALAILSMEAPAAAQAAPAPQQAAARDAAGAIPAADRQTLETRAREVVEVLSGRLAAVRVFAPDFLAQVPEAQLSELTAQLVGAYGPLAAAATVKPTSPLEGDMVLRFARAEAHAKLVLARDTGRLVTGLQIVQVTPLNDGADALAADLAALPGTANAWFAPLGEGKARLALNVDRPLAIGSAFKLYVLAALQRSIAAGRHKWTDVVPLTARSYPSGVTQDWPAGTPVTVQSLAQLMIQISDNTATDQLVTLLGREAVEEEYLRVSGAHAALLPFLTTREMFAIKTDPALRARYAAASPAQRRALLAALPKDGPPLKDVTAAFAGAPMAIDSIEWFASPRELAVLLRAFSGPDGATARGILAANKGLGPDAGTGWAYMGFKGGSEPGVLNLTWLLQDANGAWHIATLGWNNPAAPVDQAVLVGLAQRLLSLAP